MIDVAGQSLSIVDVANVAQGEKTQLTPAAKSRMQASRSYVDEIIATGQIAYGITTGFGKLSDVVIPTSDLAQLQLNLVRSHACGIGPNLSREEVRAMLLLRANVLAVGFSGARVLVAETLINMLNQGVHPRIPEWGSVGASGDLAPLAHLALTLIGEGEAELDGVVMPSAEAMIKAGIGTLELGAKEGLAVLNGTQALTGVGALALVDAYHVLSAANVAGALTLDALRDTPAAFDERLHQARPHHGQIQVASFLRHAIDGSEIRESHRYGDHRVQDAYSLRCMPQVHGAVQGVLDHLRQIVEIETGSATDNPLILPKEGGGFEAISGGNFHGAPVAYALDYASIAITDLMSISERRIERLVNPDLSEGLPPFLTRHAGLESGMMIPQVAAVGLLNQAKVLAHPASCDNMPTSAGKEDHVSMGMTSALKFRQIVDLASKVVAIELIAACQGVEFRAPLRTSPILQEVFDQVRAISPRIEQDRSLGGDIEAVSSLVKSGKLAIN